MSARRRSSRGAGRGKRAAVSFDAPASASDDSDSDGGGMQYTQSNDTPAYALSQTRDLSQSASDRDKKTLASMTPDYRENLIREATRLVLLKGISSRDPIRLQAISAELQKKFYSHSGGFRLVLAHVQRRLQGLFAFDLVEASATMVDRVDESSDDDSDAEVRRKKKKVKAEVLKSRKSEAQNSGARKDNFFLRSMLGARDHLERMNSAPAALPREKGLLMVMLATIWMTDDHAVSLAYLQDHLSRIDPNFARDKHPDFGAWKAAGGIMEHFERQGYLVKTRGAMQDDGPATALYRIGPRARIEVGVRDVCQFILETVGKAEEVSEEAIKEWMGPEEYTIPDKTDDSDVEELSESGSDSGSSSSSGSDSSSSGSGSDDSSGSGSDSSSDDASDAPRRKKGAAKGKAAATKRKAAPAKAKGKGKGKAPASKPAKRTRRGN